MMRRAIIAVIFVAVLSLPAIAVWRHCPRVRSAIAASVAGERLPPPVDLPALDLPEQWRAGIVPLPGNVPLFDPHPMRGPVIDAPYSPMLVAVVWGE